MERIQRTRSQEWDLGALDIITQDLYDNLFTTALPALLHPPASARWPFQDYAFLPMNLKGGHEQINEGVEFWQADSEFVRARLQCSTIKFDVDYPPSTPEEEGGFKFQRMVLELPGTTKLVTGERVTVIDPCQPQNSEHKMKGKFSNGNDGKVVCIHWKLERVISEWDKEPQLRWFIALNKGNSRDFPFASAQPSLAIMCEPRITTGNGTMSLISNDGRSQQLQNTRAFNFTMKNEKQLHTSSSWGFNRMLNESIFPGGTNQSTSTNGVLLPFGAIQSNSYIGDILDYIQYRNLLLQNLDFITPDVLQATATLIYLKIFISVIQDTDWLRKEVRSSEVEINPIFLFEDFKTRKTIAYILLVYGISITFFIIYLGFIRLNYAFPFDPENLENALFFLYQSSIVTKFAKLRRPEALTLQQIHTWVDRLGLQYVFSRYSDERFGVDVPEEFQTVRTSDGTEESPQVPYRDFIEDVYELD